MSGLNYGMKYRAKKGARMDKEMGVSFSSLSKKWVVRVLNDSNQPSTLAQFSDKKDAEEHYKNHAKTNRQ
tara:strand:+ start:2672 stop:2881 length:210 start_codon:yes stop_codon:yes gene_type:complete